MYIKISPTDEPTAAIERAIASIPKAALLKNPRGVLDNTLSTGIHTIELPDQPIRLLNTIIVPGTKNIKFVGNQHDVNTMAGAPIFRVLAGWSKKRWEGLFAVGGPLVQFDDQARGGFKITDCDVYNAQGPAIMAGGGVVGVTITGGKWSYCKKGIDITSEASDNWVVRNIEYIRGAGPFVHAKSSGMHVSYCFLENSHVNNQFPWLWFEGNSLDPKGFTGGQCSVDHVRFGREVGEGVSAGTGPAIETIRFGSATPSNLIMAGFSVTNCQFNGNPARNAIRMTQPLQRSVVANNCFNDYTGSIMQVDNLGPEKVRDNKFVANPHESGRQIAPIWSTGTAPKGWVCL